MTRHRLSADRFAQHTCQSTPAAARQDPTQSGHRHGRIARSVLRMRGESNSGQSMPTADGPAGNTRGRIAIEFQGGRTS